MRTKNVSPRGSTGGGGREDGLAFCERKKPTKKKNHLSLKKKIRHDHIARGGDRKDRPVPRGGKKEDVSEPRPPLCGEREHCPISAKHLESALGRGKKAICFEKGEGFTERTTSGLKGRTKILGRRKAWGKKKRP